VHSLPLPSFPFFRTQQRKEKEKRRRGGGEGGWPASWPEDAAGMLLLHHVALDLAGVGGGDPQA
jgi:hypothetical protein